MNLTYKTTMVSCFVGCAVQAIINNFVPLLFIMFRSNYGIPLEKITFLVTVNFGVQLIVDLAATKFVDRIGYRTAILSAHIFSAAGLIMLTFLPDVISPFAGMLISVTVYAIGGGIIEVLVSPIMEGCPTDNKAKAMSLLHSFYCWGHVAVVLLSTVFFAAFGIENWRIIALLWALIPIINTFVFIKAPISDPAVNNERGLTLGELFKSKTFCILLIMMLCSGACEQAVSQWASAFAESGLGITKTYGDLAGTMTFAILMGCSRAFYGKFGDRINLDKFLSLSTALCIASYLLISLVPSPVINLIGCAICGLSVGIMWPGSLSKATSSLKRGGTAMFAILALAGDLGCSLGPTAVGTVSAAGGNLKIGILSAAVFPIILLLCIIAFRGINTDRNKDKTVNSLEE